MKGKTETVTESFSNIKLIGADIDGVLTDNSMYYFDNGAEAKKFNFYDGMAVQLLKDKGIEVVFITKESTQIVKNRAEKLEVQAFQGIEDKGCMLVELMKKHELERYEVAFIGNDINDISALKAVGISVCPADAIEAVKKICQVVTKAKGGEGVLREVYERFISKRGENGR